MSTPTPVILDELPYLAATSPELPSVIQTAMDRRRRIRGRPVRLLLCGSAMRFMGRLLAGGAPLRGRAGLELVVPTLDYRLAAEFSGIGDPRLAILVHSVLGGTPAYAREYVRDDLPGSFEDFDDWVRRAVLSPASPLFREARYLLAEAPDIRDAATYHSVLAAVAAGNTSRSRIASYVGRAATEITHPLNVLEDAGLLIKRQDMLRRARPAYEIGEPLITFYQSIMRPAWRDLERRRTGDVWRRSHNRFFSNVVGPHFEHLCRTWAAGFATAGTFPDAPGDVGHGVVNDPDRRTMHEIDVVVMAQSAGASRRVLSIGEAKWGQIMGLGQLERLRRVATLLDRRGYDTRDIRLACYSGVGFDADLRTAAGRGEVLLVTPDSLYA